VGLVITADYWATIAAAQSSIFRGKGISGGDQTLSKVAKLQESQNLPPLELSNQGGLARKVHDQSSHVYYRPVTDIAIASRNINLYSI
jgi:hypothetical protein